jgi:hypothetical protein
MRLISCVQQFLDLYHFRIKGSSQRTIKAYREALALFLPFAAKYYSIKVASLSIDHLSLSSLFYISKKSLPSIKPLILKHRWALETIPLFIYWLIPAPELVKSPCSMLTTSTRLKKP